MIWRNLLRGVFLLAFQVLILKQVNLGFGSFNHITIFLYPIFLMMLPMETPVWLMLVIGAFYGFCIDSFSDTIGMHTATSIFTTYLRSGLFRILEPQGGYKQGASPTKYNFGFLWYARYALTFVFLHVFIFFSVEAFTPFRWKIILMATLPSFIISGLLVMIYSILFDPKE